MYDAPDLHFGSFRLERHEERLWDGDREAPLGRKAHAVLAQLLAQAGSLVTKEELLTTVWRDTAVSDAVLTTAVRELRRCLGDVARAPRFVETVHGRGYRFIAPVRRAQLTDQPGTRAFCGRRAERLVVDGWLKTALTGARRIGFVTGEPGLGKTAFAEELVHRAIAAGVVVGRGQCIEHYGAGEPYLPLLEAFARLLRGDASAALAEALRLHAQSWLPHLTQPAPGLGDGAAAPPPVTAVRMMRELADAVEVLTAGRPLLLLLEDLHWSDAATVEWLGYLARRRDPARLLVVGTYRPVELIVAEHPLRTLLPQLRHLPQVEELALNYLSPADVEEFLGTRSVPVGKDKAVARRLHRRSHGHPLFLVEIVDALQRDGRLAPESDIDEDLREIASMLPEGARQLIDQQIERLAEPDRCLLEVGGVAGSEFAAALVAAATECSEKDIDARCAALARAHLLLPVGAENWPDGTVTTRYRFRHDLWRDVASGRLSPGRRARLHRRIAERLEAAHGEGAGMLASELAVHFEAGQDPARALAYRRRGADNALRRSAYAEAYEHLEQGLELLTAFPEDDQRGSLELDVTISLATVRGAIDGWGSDETRQLHERARALSRRRGERELELRAVAGQITVAVVRGELVRTRALCRTLLELTEGSTAGSSFRLLAAMELGGTDQLRGRLQASRQQFERAVGQYERSDHQTHLALHGMDLGVFSSAWMSHTLCLLGEVQSARRRSREAIELAEELGHPFTQAVALSYAAMSAQLEGDAHGTRQCAHAAAALAERHGFPYYAAWARMLLGWSAAMGGDLAGIGEIRSGLASFEKLGRRSLSYWRSLLVESLARLGDQRAASHELEHAFAALDGTEERWMEADLHRLAAVLGEQRDRTAAAASYQRAVAVARDQGAVTFERRAAAGLAALAS